MTELIKYKATDTVLQSLQDQNTNMDIISTELEKKLDKSGGTLTGDLVLGEKDEGLSHSIGLNGIATLETVRDAGVKALLLNSQYTLIFKPGAGDSYLHVPNLGIHGNVRLTKEIYNTKQEVLQQTSWESVSGTYPFRYKLLVAGLERGQYLDITIDKDSMEIAEKAQICPTVEENNGFAFIYAKKKPTGDISVRRKVMV